MKSKINSLLEVPSIASYLDRINAKPRSPYHAVVEEPTGNGYWRDRATIRFDAEGAVTAPDAYKPTEDEAKVIEIECRQFEWPQRKKVHNWTPFKNPPDIVQQIAEARRTGRLFEFRDIHGQIEMVQIRHQKAIPTNGEAKYLNFTLWDDDIIRIAEPEGKLPLWGVEQLKHHSVVFLHEGAKAAKLMADMVQGATQKHKDEFANFPWQEMGNAAHMGWIGGAENPQRTDWSVLAGATKVTIVADNDKVGVAAISRIAPHIRCPTYSIQFSQLWPASFDLADKFPAKMFKTRTDGTRHYAGPSFRSVLHPATFMTDLIPNPRGKGTPVIRDHAKDAIGYVEEADVFVFMDMPEIVYDEKVLNRTLANFSHTANVAQAIVSSKRGRIARMCYDPSLPSGVVTYEGTSAFNCHIPSPYNQHIQPWKLDGDAPAPRQLPGDLTPWEGYLRNLFPIDSERKEVERWVATVIARPEVKMDFGLLLISRAHGVGKTTLGESILRPIVGFWNTGMPDETDITTSQFTEWCAEKRLVLIEEIYSGDSWVTYNRLKSKITGKTVTVNRKFQRKYEIKNWIHYIASSNSKMAIRIENDDRRWLIPECSETLQPKSYWAAFHAWLESGGLELIVNWAERYGDYVSPGEHAPFTKKKAEVIEASESAADRAVEDLCRIILETEPEADKKDNGGDHPLKEGVVLSTTHVEAWVKEKEPKAYIKKQMIGKIMEKAGLTRIEGPGNDRIAIGTTYHSCFASPKAWGEVQRLLADITNAHDDAVKNEAEKAFKARVKAMVRRPGDVIEEEM